MKEVLDLESALGWCLKAPLVVVVREFFCGRRLVFAMVLDRERMNCLP